MEFRKVYPGLVGGHCLPVDPYYFSHIAEKNKIQTRVTLAGRSINEYMRKFLIKKIKKKLRDNRIEYKKDKIIFAGLTYKKDVSDMRNSQSLKIFNYFKKINSNIFGLDPYLERNLNKKIINLKDKKIINEAKSIILLVNHEKFGVHFKKLKVKDKIINILN